MERPTFVFPDWYRQESAEQIQARMMASLPPDIDNIEGGFPYDFTMPTALEADELLNFVLVEALKIIFPAWSYGVYLDYHAAANGIIRHPPNQATGVVTVTGVPGTVIPAGTVFCVPAVNGVPAIEFAACDTVVIEPALQGAMYGVSDVDVAAVVGGRSGNVSADTVVILATPIAGIVSVTNGTAFTGGTLEETDDELYTRIVMAEQTDDGAAGNDADYIRWAKEVSGVGTVVVDAQYEEEHPNWVKLIVLDANGEPANDAMRQAVYNHIMGPENRSQDRRAPIGAVLVVEAPSSLPVSIAITGATIARDTTVDEVIHLFKVRLNAYYAEAKKVGEVRRNRVHAIFTGTPGVEDFASLTINGSTDNIAIGIQDYPVTEEVTIS